VEKIEQENQELRGKVDEYMQALAKTATTTGTTETQAPEAPEVTPQNMSVEEVTRIIQEQMTAQTAQQRLAQNTQMVEQELIKVYGDAERAKEALAVKAKELNLTDETLSKLVAESPQAAVGLFGGGAPASPSSSSGTRNTVAIGQGNQIEEGTWQYWEEIRKKDPKLYRKPSMAMKRHKDAQRLGEKFFN